MMPLHLSREKEEYSRGWLLLQLYLTVKAPFLKDRVGSMEALDVVDQCHDKFGTAAE